MKLLENSIVALVVAIPVEILLVFFTSWPWWAYVIHFGALLLISLVTGITMDLLKDLLKKRRER